MSSKRNLELVLIVVAGAITVHVGAAAFLAACGEDQAGEKNKKANHRNLHFRNQHHRTHI